MIAPLLPLIPVFVALIAIGCTLWRVGFARALANFGDTILGILTRGGIRLPHQLSEKATISVGAIVLVALFVPFIIFALRVH